MIFFFFSSLSYTAKSNPSGNDFYLTPSISLGYTFGAGLYYGLNINFFFKQMQTTNGIDAMTGISLSKYWNIVNSKYGHNIDVHRITTLNLVYSLDIIEFKTGFGMAKNPWGYGSNLRCVIYGLSTDLSIKNFSGQFVPDLGIKGFFYPLSKWRWFDLPYISAYGQYEKAFPIK